MDLISNVWLVAGFATVYVISVVFAWFQGADYGERRVQERLQAGEERAAQLRSLVLELQMEVIKLQTETRDTFYPDPFAPVASTSNT